LVSAGVAKMQEKGNHGGDEALRCHGYVPVRASSWWWAREWSSGVGTNKRNKKKKAQQQRGRAEVERALTRDKPESPKQRSPGKRSEDVFK